MIDEGLRPYVTNPRQGEYLEAYLRLGTFRAVGREFGVGESQPRTSLQRLQAAAAKKGYSPQHDMTHTVPDGYRVKGTSTLYDDMGNVRQQWVKSQVDQERQLELMQEAISALCEPIEAIPPVAPPETTNDALLSLYPVGDHHIGMLSWHEETGSDYNTAISEKLLIGAMDYLVSSAPKSELGVVVLCGDFLHYDGYEAVTPASKHQLDADTRYPKMVRAAMKTVRYAISRALDCHAYVHVVISSGNHDPASMAFLREAISCLYENDQRVSVDRTPSPFHYVVFGKNLFGFHHGDKVKMDKLPLLMAEDRAVDWGATKHRYIFTGHVHHDSVKDCVGARVESLRILPPVDAYAHGMGYRSGRDMKRIDFHREHGEVCRQLVTPEMLA